MGSEDLLVLFWRLILDAGIELAQISLRRPIAAEPAS